MSAARACIVKPANWRFDVGCVPGSQFGPRPNTKIDALNLPSPWYTSRNAESSLSILTAGQLISEELGIKLENVPLQTLGRAKRVHGLALV